MIKVAVGRGVHVRSCAVVLAVVLAVSGQARAETRSSCMSTQVDARTMAAIDALQLEYGRELVAVGRVDKVSSRSGVEVFGHVVHPSAGESYRVGDYAAIIDWSDPTTSQRLYEVRPVALQYVPGNSEVLLSGKLTAFDPLQVGGRIGSIEVNFTELLVRYPSLSLSEGIAISVRGTQAQPKRAITANCVVGVSDGSMGTGSTDGSMGTGSTDGSMGTGSTDGSMGTGSTDGSMGTGSTDGSMGTGSADGTI
ncbi:MAG: hypothetical protein EPO25_07955 [Gammaproteobacteria bacterium]|nr:MAG: hypothetical protein EPO25_07955 [Gammaproteobacteria bacterium]